LGRPSGISRCEAILTFMALYLSILSCICITAASYVQLWDMCTRLHFLAGPPGLALGFSPNPMALQKREAQEMRTWKEHIQQTIHPEYLQQSHICVGAAQTRAAGPLSHQGLLQTQPAHPRLRVLRLKPFLAPGPRQPTIDILELLRLTLHAPEAYSGTYVIS